MFKKMGCLVVTLWILSGVEGHAWVTAKNFKEQISTWQGRKADRLVEHFGAPDSVYPLSKGGKIVSYVMNSHSGSSVIPIGSTYSVVNRQWYCKVDFKVDSDDEIKSINWNGNNCKSPSLKTKHKKGD